MPPLSSSGRRPHTQQGRVTVRWVQLSSAEQEKKREEERERRRRKKERFFVQRESRGKAAPLGGCRPHLLDGVALRAALREQLLALLDVTHGKGWSVKKKGWKKKSGEKDV